VRRAWLSYATRNLLLLRNSGWRATGATLELLGFNRGHPRKIGKADLDRVTEATGLPTRLHQQIRKLSETYGKRAVNYKIAEKHFNITTKDAKIFETSRLQAVYDATNKIPYGNRNSFKPS
jgi:hypothetical protein